MMETKKAKVLVIDDEPISRRIISNILEKRGFWVNRAVDGEAGLQQLMKDSVDAVITDRLMPKLDGIALLERIRRVASDVPVIVITKQGSVDLAVKAMQLGAASFLTKPIVPDQLFTELQRAIQQRDQKRRINRAKFKISKLGEFRNLMRKSRAMQKISDVIAALAKADSTVLIQGETGTGKELIAKAIHRESRRKQFPFIALNCAALSENLLESELFGHEKGSFTGAMKTRIGRFERANGGTLFLDEIGDIPISTQVKLLRVLQEKTIERVGGDDYLDVDVRIVSATNKDLRREVSDNKFRADLFYRLNVVLIEVPPLRDRVEDIPDLASYFLQEHATSLKKPIHSIAPDAMRLLLGHYWPGNVRELQNVMERAVILERTSILTSATVSKSLHPHEHKNYLLFPYAKLPFREAKLDLLNRFEREYLKQLLEQEKGNITKAARVAQMDYKNFYSKMKKHNISKWRF